MNGKGCVYLVGAGCGSAEWITQRGRALLEECDAVVYDDLLDPALLALADGAEKYPVGKRCGRHSVPQNETNELLVRLGLEGKRVVRLKGGDPFVFGRGGEEFLALREAGVRCETVPGISSCIAIPAAAGIPVTHRKLSRSFHVVTGHTADGGAPESLEALAALHGTLVFLMGLGHLDEIAAGLVRAGKPADTPAAVVSDGNSPHPAAVRGTLADIAARVREAGVEAPAVIVVGPTAALDLRAEPLPLTGVRVGMAGTPEFTGRLGRALRALGAQPSVYLEGRVQALGLPDTAQLEAADWLVLTSRNGAECLFRALREARIDVRRLAKCRFAAIGPATADALEAHGIFPDVCAEPATSEGLAAALLRAAKPGQTALLLRSESGTPELPAALRAGGMNVCEHALYRTKYDPVAPAPEAGYLAFGSAQGVRAYVDAFGAPEKTTVCAAVGPVTARALRAVTDAPFVTGADISAESLAAAIAEHRG